MYKRQVERRLYFPAKGPEPGLARPVQVTFDRVESIPAPNIGIKAAPDDESGGNAPATSDAGLRRILAQVSSGQVGNEPTSQHQNCNDDGHVHRLK